MKLNYKNPTITYPLACPFKVKHLDKEVELTSMILRRLKNTDLGELSASLKNSSISSSAFLYLGLNISRIVIDGFEDKEGVRTNISLDKCITNMPAVNLFDVVFQSFNLTRGTSLIACSYKFKCKHSNIFDLNPLEPVPSDVEPNRGFKRDSSAWFTSKKGSLKSLECTIKLDEPFTIKGIPAKNEETGESKPTNLEMTEFKFYRPTVGNMEDIFADEDMAKDPDLWSVYMNIFSINGLPQTDTSELKKLNGNGSEGILSFSPKYRKRITEKLNDVGVQFNEESIDCLICGKNHTVPPDFTNFLDFLM